LWYAGFTVDPPVYPTRVRRTPGRLPNRESGPQNQPKAKVAVSVAPGRDASIGGIAAVRGAVPFPILPVIAAATDPAASNPKRIVFLARRNGSVVLFTVVPPAE
jgi:hypothetical protein